jgi:hypothetical protein
MADSSLEHAAKASDDKLLALPGMGLTGLGKLRAFLAQRETRTA